MWFGTGMLFIVNNIHILVAEMDSFVCWSFQHVQWYGMQNSGMRCMMKKGGHGSLMLLCSSMWKSKFKFWTWKKGSGLDWLALLKIREDVGRELGQGDGSWPTGWQGGQSATSDSEKIQNNQEKQGKNQEKSGKNQEKLGKKEKKSGRKAKIRKFLSLCPSWQIGLSTLLLTKSPCCNGIKLWSWILRIRVLGQDPYVIVDLGLGVDTLVCRQVSKKNPRSWACSSPCCTAWGY